MRLRRESGQRRLALNVRAEGDLGGTARRVAEAVGKADLPKGTIVRYGGKIEEARETQRRLAVAIAVALALVFGLLYLALWLAGETWNISSIVGVIGLFGVAAHCSTSSSATSRPGGIRSR